MNPVKRNAYRCMAICLGVVAPLLLAEAALRAGAVFYDSYRLSRRPLPADGSLRILCVGDSFTFGFGAHKGGSYPERLQGILDRSYGKGRYTVVNRGVPGQNTTELAERVGAWMEEDRPQILLVLTGWNNSKLYHSSYFRFAPLRREGWRGVLVHADMVMSESRVYSLMRLAWLDLRARYRSRSMPAADSPESRLARHARDLWNQSLMESDPSRAVKLKEEARAELRRLIAANPGFPFPHFLLGETYKIDDWSLAVKEWRISSDLDPAGELGRSHLWEEDPGEIDSKALRQALFFDLDRIQAAAAANGAEFVLQNYADRAPVNVDIGAYAEARRIRLIDQCAQFKELAREGKPLRLYTIADGHMNDEGYALMAELVFRRLLDWGLRAAVPALEARR